MRHFNNSKNAFKYIENLFKENNLAENKINNLQDLLQISKQESKNFNKEHMSIGFIEGNLIYFISKLIKANKIIEIGTFTGYSTLWLIKSLKNKKGRIFTFEKNPAYAQCAENIFKQLSNYQQVNIFQGDAQKKLSKVEEHGPFDLIFIDANKSAYLKYLSWSEKNIKKKGIIIADNTFLFGSVYNNQIKINKKHIEIMKKFNQQLFNKKKYNSIFIPTQQGLIIAEKKF